MTDTEVSAFIFDVCPSPPLIWSNFGAGQLIALARPAEVDIVRWRGAAAPVTLLGCRGRTWHAAECLSGITVHQLAHAGSPLFGAAPSTRLTCARGGAIWFR